MQDQLTGGQSSLQQPRDDLQQNTSNLQQSGSPTAAGNTSSVLSETAPQGQLRVSTATTPTPSTVAPSTAQPGGNGALLWLLLVPLVIVIALLLRNLAITPMPDTIEESPAEPIPHSKPVKKTKKKSSKRKKSYRR